MRIAISGSHRVGKTSLAEALASILPGYELASEPYHALEEEGHEFSDMPSLDDFLLQLERSLASLEQSEPNTIFDRCPLDIVAYLQTHEERDAFHLEEWSERIREAMARLSLLVFVPIERPDRIPVPREDNRLRADVDEKLEDLLMDSRYAGDVEVLHVGGTLENRVETVRAQLRALA